MRLKVSKCKRNTRIIYSNQQKPSAIGTKCRVIEQSKGIK